MDKWKLITDPSEIKHPAIFQEKMVVLAPDESDREKLLLLIREKEGELCDPPLNVKERYPYAIAFWANKHNPKVTMKDIKEGNLRMKIDYDSSD